MKRLWEGDPSRIAAALRDRIENVLGVLDAAATPADLDLPGYRLHALKGDLKGIWSVTLAARETRFVNATHLLGEVVDSKSGFPAFGVLT